MNTTFISTLLLPGAVGVIMFGLGLHLTPDDFRRVLRMPGAVCLGLAVQTLGLVTIALLMTRLFALPPSLALGLMLLAASPGGALASFFSHLAHGDVALNLTLTAVNSLLALAWVPLVMGWSLEHFLGAGHYVPPPMLRILELATIVLGPAMLGMLVRRLSLRLTHRIEKPVLAASLALLVTVIASAIRESGAQMVQHFGTVGLACVTFNLVSLGLGYASPRALGLGPRQSTAIAFEIGVHNASVAMFMAIAVVGDPAAAVPPALYGLIQMATATVLVLWLRRRSAAGRASATAHGTVRR